MCNDYGNRVSYRAYVEEFSQIRLPVVFPKPDAAPNLEPRDEIWPTDVAPVIRPVEAGVELVQLRWGLAPGRPKARAVINMRSEGRTFARNRCLVPASHYYEFTGATSPKTRWRFTRIGQEWFCFAGLIGRGESAEGPIDAFTLLTCEPGPDVTPIHNRQPIIVERLHWAAWLTGSGTATELLKPSAAGTLAVVQAPRGS
jgi:putative SOS response-associated peptidase YedK